MIYWISHSTIEFSRYILTGRPLCNNCWILSTKSLFANFMLRKLSYLNNLLHKMHLNGSFINKRHSFRHKRLLHDFSFALFCGFKTLPFR